MRRRLPRELQRADDAFEFGAVTDRHVDEHALVAPEFADRLDQLGEFDVVAVHLVDDDHAADARLARLLEDAARVDFDAACGR